MEYRIEPKLVMIMPGSSKTNGNSLMLGEQVKAGIREAGGMFESYILYIMNIEFCRGCHQCRREKAKACVIEDDMQGLYPRLKKADAEVSASHVYWAHFTTQMKIFLDRCFAIFAASSALT